MPEFDEDAVDRIGRAAGAELRRPAPESGASRIAAAARRQRIMRNATIGALVVAGVIVAGTVVVLTRGSDDTVRTGGPVPTAPTSHPSLPLPATTRPGERLTTTAPEPVRATVPTTTPVLPSAAPTAGPETTAAPASWDEIAALQKVPWESAGISRTCGEVWWAQQQTQRTRCTELVIDPSGIPVTYDPTTRLVTRHQRESRPVAFTLPDEYVDPSLIAAGPDDVVYFALENEWPKASDVLAVSVAPNDTGTVLDRFTETMGIGDADLFLTPQGMVLSGWNEQGFRPAHDATPFVEWIRRGGEGTAAHGTFPVGQFNDSDGLVDAWNWQWSLGERLVVSETPGTGRVVGTHDGGFLAVYSEHIGDLRAEVMRGYRDGTVVHWLLPASWSSPGTPILEPQGTILLPNGDTFVRVAPFGPRSNGWDGSLQIDPESGTAEAVGLNEFLDSYFSSLDPSGDGTLPWDLGPIAFANAVAGSPSSPAELRTVEEGPTDEARVSVTVTTERHLDDSVYGTRLVIHLAITDAGFRVERIDWSNACQPGRGHEGYQTALCS